MVFIFKFAFVSGYRFLYPLMSTKAPIPVTTRLIRLNKDGANQPDSWLLEDICSMKYPSSFMFFVQ